MHTSQETSVGRSPTAALSRGPAFVVTAFSLASLMAVAGAPAPLYGMYRQLYGVSSSGVTGSFAVYIVMVAATLLVCGRLSNFVGRRAVLGAALVLAMVSCAILALIDGTEDLVIGRALQGASSGLAKSAVTAYVIDLQSPRRPAIGSILSSAGPTAGLALGAVISGALVQFGPHPTQLVYAIFGAVLAVCLLSVPVLPETARRSRGALGSLKPRVAVPHHARRAFLGVCACALAVWALSGFYQSLGPELAATQLGHPGQFVGGLVVASLVGPTVLGGLVSSRMRPVTAMWVGLTIVIAAILGVLTGLHWGSTALFFAASIVCGCGFGCAFNGAMQSMLGQASPGDRVGVLSAIYLVSYFGAAIPAYLAGVAEPHWGLQTVAVLYGFLVIALSLIAVVLVRLRPRR